MMGGMKEKRLGPYKRAAKMRRAVGTRALLHDASGATPLMKPFVTATLLFTCLLTLQLGCATLLADKVKAVPIQTTPTGADVYIDGIKRGRTPLTLQLDPRRSYTLVFKGEGLEDQVFDVRNEVGVGWVVLDVILGGLPAIIDAQTGAWHSFVPESVQVPLRPSAQAHQPGAQQGTRPEPGAPSPEPMPAAQPAKPPPSVNCNLSGTPEWQNASASQKKKMLDECRRQQGAQ